MPAPTFEDAAGEIVTQLERGWNEGDGSAFAAPFEDDADFVNVRGQLLKGRRVVAQGHDAIFAGIYRGSRVGYTVRQMRSLGDHLGLLHLDAGLDVPAGPLAGTHKALLSLLLRQRDGKWCIAALHNTLVSEPPGQ